jgi:outer membrane protein assembly factor BamB
MKEELDRREFLIATGLVSAASASGCIQGYEGSEAKVPNQEDERGPNNSSEPGRGSQAVKGIISRNWSMELDRRVDSSPAVVDGIMYFGSHNGNVYAVAEEGSDGRGCSIEWPTFGYADCRNEVVDTFGPEDSADVLWKFEAGDRVVSGPVLAEGNVYLGSYDNNVYSIDSETGDENWRYETGDQVRAVAGRYDRGTFYIGSDDGNLYALDAGSGESIWEYETDGPVVCSPSIEDGKLYFGSRGSGFYCLNKETGEGLWEFEETGKVCGSSPAIYDDRLYFGSVNGTIYCLNKDGGKVWEYETGGPMSASPTVYDGNLYMSSGGKNLYSLDPETGDVVWSRDMGGVMSASPVPYEGNILIGIHRGETGGYMFVVDSETGDVLGRDDVGERRIGSTPAVVDDTAYFGSDRGVHAVELSI